MVTNAIYYAMRACHPRVNLLRTVLLVVGALILSVGSAAAHGLHGGGVAAQAGWLTAYAADVGSGDAPATVPALAETMTAVPEHRSAGGCPDNGKVPHSAGNCCTVACHAALTAQPAVEPGRVERNSLRLFGLADMLVGRLGDRTERPPKNG